MLAGRLSPDEAARIVSRRPGAVSGEGVRYTTVGRLRMAGFEVKATPTRRIKEHMSVIMEGSQPWTDAVAARFDSCFEGDPVWKEGK